MEQYSLQDYPHLEQLALGVVRMAPGKSRDLNFHDHRNLELVFLLHSANTLHWAEGRSSLLKRGDVLLLLPGMSHAYEHTDELELVNLLYDPGKLPMPLLDGGSLELFRKLTSPHPGELCSPEQPIVTLTELQLQQIIRELEDLEAELRRKQPGYHLRCFACLLNILTWLGRAGRETSVPEVTSSAEEALVYLNRHFRENVSAAKLARLCCLSERSLYLRFRERTGYSPQEYRRRKQIEYARELLEKSSLSLERIAEECGFCDSNHLIKRFSACIGVSPGSYRRRKRLRQTD